MTLPVYPNPISLEQLQTEFGGSNPASLSEYYAGGAYVFAGTVGFPNGISKAIPTSGTLKFSDFFGATASVYVLTPTMATLDEGAALSVYLTTTSVPIGTTVYWTSTGTGITNDDFTSGYGSVASGSYTTSSNGTPVLLFGHSIANDHLTEGTEVLTITLHTVSSSGPVVATSVITINDTSLTQYGATYSIVPVTSTVNEGDTATFTITTTNIPDGTILYWATVDALATPPAPTPAYSITPSVTSVAEGQIVTFTVDTINVPDGTQLRWTTVDATPGIDTITITTASPLSGGTVGVAYSSQIVAVSSTVPGPYVFTVTSGSLPSGMSLATSGTLAGYPYVEGSYNFTVTVSGSGTTATKTFDIVVAASGSGGGGGTGSIEEIRWSQLYQ